MSVRIEKVASLIKHELGNIISREYSGGELGFSTVTEVRMTPDLKLAKVSISVMGSEEKRRRTFEKLEEEKSHIRSLLANQVSLKFIPALQFYGDETAERVQRLEYLFKQIHKSNSNQE